MADLEPPTMAEIAAHVVADFPREACGLVIIERGKQKYVACKNDAEGTEHFMLSPADYAAAEDRGEIIAVVHSHPNAGAKASEHDLVVCEQTGLPWYIVAARKLDDGSIDTNEWASIRPTGYVAPLVGRTFSHGVLDCYSLIRDWYKRELGIDLPVGPEDAPRVDNWWLKGQNLYEDNFARAGFRVMADDEIFQPGDLFLAQIRSPVANHGGVYIGDNLVLHHLHGRLSSRDVWGGYLAENTVKRLRYVGVKTP